LELRLESVHRGVLVTGIVSAPVAGQCGRCLDPVTDELDVEFCELFAYRGQRHRRDDRARTRFHRIVGDLLDVEPVVRDVVVLALPWNALCRGGPIARGCAPAAESGWMSCRPTTRTR